MARADKVAAFAAGRPRFGGRFVKPCDHPTCWAALPNSPPHYHDPKDPKGVKYHGTPTAPASDASEHDAKHVASHGAKHATVEDSASKAVGVHGLVGDLPADPPCEICTHPHSQHPKRKLCIGCGEDEAFAKHEYVAPLVDALTASDASGDASPPSPHPIPATTLGANTPPTGGVLLAAPKQASLGELETDPIEDWDALDLETELPDRIRRLEYRFILLERLKWNTAAAIGQALASAKKRIEHGRWEGWLRDQLGMHERKAQRLMQLAKPTNLSLLAGVDPGASIDAALREVQQARKKANLTQREEQATDRSGSIELPTKLVIETADVLALPIPDESVEVIITSPPYGIGIEYDLGGDDDSYPEYLEKVEQWAIAMFKALKPRGRLCLNVPFDVMYHDRPHPILHDWLSALRVRDFLYRTTILLPDAHRGGKMGIGTPSAPYVFAPAEAVLVLYKERWDRGDNPVAHDLTPQELWVLADGVWRANGQESKWHPAPFPHVVEDNGEHHPLPWRLVRLFSFPGDVVMDPFGGSGTTAIEAFQLGRSGWSFDRSPKYTSMAKMHAQEALAPSIPDDQ